MIRVFVLFICVLGFTVFAYGQGKPNLTQLVPRTEVQRNACGFRLHEFQSMLQFGNTSRPVIVIAHLNNDEKSDYAKRRLHNAKAYLSNSAFPRRWADEFVVTAEGHRVSGNGYLDFFLDGELTVRMFTGLGQDLYLGDCGAGTGDKQCSTEFEKQFYPCRGS